MKVKPASIEQLADALTMRDSKPGIHRPEGRSKKMEKPELMPANLQEFRGQIRVKTILADAIKSATIRNCALDHILLEGLSGQGKTTLAWLIAQESKRYIVTFTASSLEKPLDIYNIFKDVEKEKFPIIFIDEIHAMKKPLCELLYIPMELPGTKLHFPSMFGTMNYDIIVKPFTLIGATAGESGRLPKPMLDRVQLRLTLDKYTVEDMCAIAAASSKKLGMSLSATVVSEISRRSSFIPRKANNLLRMLRNMVVSRNIKTVNDRTLTELFALLQIDSLGLDDKSRTILREIAATPKGSLGCKAIASIIGVDERTLTNIYEPELISLGFLRFLPRGRAITEAGMNYITPPTTNP